MDKLPEQLISLDILRVNRGLSKICKCHNRNFEIDATNKLVYCSKCHAIIEPYEALYEIANSRERIVSENERLYNQRKEIANYKPYLVAIKRIEESSRRGKMLPHCPRCKEIFYLEELTWWTSKDYCKPIEYYRKDGE